MAAFFENKVVWITGASSGIGEALAYAFSAEGARLVLSARTVEKLEKVKQSCAFPDRIRVLPIDLSQSEGFEAKVLEVISHFGRIDYLINNGGISQRSEAWETPEAVERRIMEVNFFGNTALTKAVLPAMQRQRSGHIVVMSSIAGKFGFFLRSSYSASKHALHGYYESLRLEEEKNGIAVTLICPGKISTAISVHALDKEGKGTGVMDPAQADGMPAAECAAQILKAVRRKKEEVLIGRKEVMAVTIKRFFPALFRRIIRRQPAT